MNVRKVTMKSVTSRLALSLDNRKERFSDNIEINYSTSRKKKAVQLEMSRFPFRSSLVFLNFFGICCHTLKNKKLSVSKLWVFYSFVKIIPFFVVQVLLQISSSFRVSVINNFVEEIDKMSSFTILMIGIINLIVMTSCFLISFLGVWHSKQIVTLFQLGLELFYKFDEKNIKALKNNWIKLITLTIVLSSGFAKIMMSTVKSDLLSAFVGIVMAHPPFTILCFMSILKFCEIFILQLLKNFIGNFENISKRSSRDFVALANEYENINRFCKGFNKFFGVQITMAVMILALVTVFDVSICCEHFY